MLSVWRLCSLNTLHRPSGVFMLTSALPSGASVHFYGRVVGSEEVWTGLCGAENSLKDQAVVDPLPVGREPDREFADKLLVGRVEIELDRLPSHGRRNGHSGPPCGRIGLRGGFRFLFFWLGELTGRSSFGGAGGAWGVLCANIFRRSSVLLCFFIVSIVCGHSTLCGEYTSCTECHQ